MQHQPLASQTSLSGLGPAQVAVLLVDFQNQFCHPAAASQSHLGTQQNAATAQRAQAFAARAAAVGAQVVYTQQVCDPACLTPRQRQWDETLGLCRTGSWEAELFLPPLAGATVVVKHRFDIWQSPAFAAWLARTPVEGFVITGVELRCCVLFAVLGADERGYRLVVPQDLVSGVDAGEATYNRAVREYLHFAYDAPASGEAVLAAWGA